MEYGITVTRAEGTKCPRCWKIIKGKPEGVPCPRCFHVIEEGYPEFIAKNQAEWDEIRKAYADRDTHYRETKEWIW